MNTISTPFIPGNLIASAAKNRKIIKHNLSEAAVHESKSARYLREGKYEKAAYCAILAQEFLCRASEAKREDIKLHALYN
jgi:hypothetical protein